MSPSNDKRIIIAVGAGLAVLAAVVLALVFSGGRQGSAEPPPASRGGLTVDVADAPSLEPTRQLRCFVEGQYIGMATLTECAQRNGLATDALDVGIDATGALAAAPTAAFAPVPELPPVSLSEPVDVGPPAATPTTPAAAPAPSGGTACLRHTGSEWRALSGNMSLNQCVQALYAGTCVRPGEAQYGRSGDLTLRLVPRRVEQSSDNNRFRMLAEQDRNCQFPGLN